MARPKKNVEESVVETKDFVVAENNSTIEEQMQTRVSNETSAREQELEKKLEALQSQLDMMARLISSGNASAVPVSDAEDRFVRFINLAGGTLVVKGSQMYNLEGQFSFKDFPYHEARVVVNNMPNAISRGLLYIADSEFVKECRLEHIYHNILSDAQLKNFFNSSSENAVEIYKNAPEGQQKLIIDMIVEKRYNGEKVDANVLMEISELCGRDLLAIKKVEE